MAVDTQINKINVLDKFPPGQQLHRDIRAAFARKGDSLNAWAIRNKLKNASIRLATHGVWNGEKGQALRLWVIKDSGLIDTQ